MILVPAIVRPREEGGYELVAFPPSVLHKPSVMSTSRIDIIYCLCQNSCNLQNYIHLLIYKEPPTMKKILFICHGNILGKVGKTCK